MKRENKLEKFENFKLVEKQEQTLVGGYLSKGTGAEDGSSSVENITAIDWELKIASITGGWSNN
jgi:hypothetical protein